MAYPRSFLGLLLAGFTMVAAPLVGALAYSAWHTERLAEQSRDAVFTASQAARASRSLVNRVGSIERLAQQLAVLDAPELTADYGRVRASFRQVSDELFQLPLGARQLEAVKKKLIEGKPQLRKYWTTAGELINLYASGEVWISNTWGGFQVAELQKQGIPVKEFLPKEKADGWVDNWQIVKGTPNADCAYKFINFTLSPRGQCGISSVTGYSAANPVAAKQCMSPEEYTAKHQDDINYVNSLVMWEMPARLDVYTNTWNAIKAAE